MDETHVDGEFGQRKKVYNFSDTNHGGFTATTGGSGDGQHVTVVLAVSDSGKKAPPFFIVEGKRNMSNWYLKLERSNYRFRDGTLNILCEDGWFLTDACVVMADKGSMDMKIITLFMKHLNSFVRKHIPSNQHYALLLDGHSSRKGIDWLELAREFNCEVVQSPANTSHFLQPYDMHVNKKFQTTARRMRDALLLASLQGADTRSIHIKLMVGVFGAEAIAPEEIRKSWGQTGLWPMTFSFPERWKRWKDDFRDKANTELARLESYGPCGSLPAVRQRQSDMDTFNYIASIVDGVRNGDSHGLSSALQKAAKCLEERQTVHSILASKSLVVTAKTATKVSAQNSLLVTRQKNIALPAGTIAEYLSDRDVIARRREAEAQKQAEEAAKVQSRIILVEKRKERAGEKGSRTKIRQEAKDRRKR